MTPTAFANGGGLNGGGADRCRWENCIGARHGQGRAARGSEDDRRDPACVNQDAGEAPGRRTIGNRHYWPARLSLL